MITSAEELCNTHHDKHPDVRSKHGRDHDNTLMCPHYSVDILDRWRVPLRQQRGVHVTPLGGITRCVLFYHLMKLKLSLEYL